MLTKILVQIDSYDIWLSNLSSSKQTNIFSFSLLTRKKFIKQVDNRKKNLVVSMQTNSSYFTLAKSWSATGQSRKLILSFRLVQHLLFWGEKRVEKSDLSMRQSWRLLLRFGFGFAIEIKSISVELWIVLFWKPPFSISEVSLNRGSKRV